MTTNLQSLTSELRSSKITERIKALESVKETFKRDSIVLSLGSGDWIVVFNALFDAFGVEKSASLKSGNLPTGKTGVAAVRRLQQVAETIRWMTERGVRRINRKVVAALVAHFISHLKLRGSLFDPVALPYAKALHCLASFTPHMEHLDRVTWIKLVELSCHVVLDISLNKHFEPDTNDWEDEASTHPESGLSANDAHVQHDDQDENPSTPSRKRTRMGSVHPPNSVPRGSTPGVQEIHVVSHEQREFMALLAVLLQDPYTPILSKDNPHLPGAILHRLRLILFRYPGESSLYHDCLLAVSATVSQLSLNHQNLIHHFAVSTWDKLIGMWGSKSNRSKENLVVVLRLLFPYISLPLGSVDSSHRFDYCDELNRLWKLMGSEAERRGVEGLSLESMRLDISPRDRVQGNGPFVAKTFQSSWHFDANQALIWGTLQLQADCAEKLYLLSESIHSTTEAEGRGKRIKVENPISSLLSAIQVQISCGIRAYHLQSLLFFVDRHWGTLHLTLRQDVISTLLQFLSFDDALVQSWTFMCFAAIAHSEATSIDTPSLLPQEAVIDRTTWDTIWTHAIRRSTVPAVTRAACHTAHTLLFHSNVLLTPHRIHGELETFGKDLDVQGPSFPYDSVCAFLVRMMQVANRDVRLYRMQVEEKVLAWFMEAWKPGGLTRSRMSPCSIDDVLSLLTSICGVTKSAQLLHTTVIPDSPIARAMTEELDFAVLRDFLLYARIPSRPSDTKATATIDSNSELWLNSVQSQAPIEDRDLIQPRGRERRVSAYLLKAMEDSLQDWESSRDTLNRATAEKIRSYLDLAVVAIFFQATLLTHGTMSHRRVLQAACKVLRAITPMITAKRWTQDERLLIVMAIEPLVVSEADDALVPPWEILLPPGPGAGIRSDLLRPKTHSRRQEFMAGASARRYLQRAALRSTDLQDVIPNLLDTLRDLLGMSIGHTSDVRESNAMDVDEEDGFNAVPPQMRRISSYGNSASAPKTIEATVRICISALSMFPVLQSWSGESTRDKDLLELLLECEGQDLLILGPSFLHHVQRRTLNFSTSSFSSLLEKVGSILTEYQWSRSEGLTSFIIHLLQSTMHIWISRPVAEGEVGDQVRALCHWLAGVLEKEEGGARSWSCRDGLIRFFDQYLEQDPSEDVWTDFGQSEVEVSPSSLLPSFGNDEDIRVRFRAATADARMLSPATLMGSDPTSRYVLIKENLTTNIEDYEGMISRLVCLGNLVVTCSAVRRGAYWHFLEASLFSSRYTRHIESILSSAASSLGLSNFCQLFEAYASQIAYSIRQGLQDFLRIPPHLLGYKDRRDCAERTFHAFTPTNVLASGPQNMVEHGRRLFLSHCAAIQKSPADGIRECFAEIVGYQIVWWLGEHGPNDGDIEDELEDLLKERVKETGETYDVLLRQYADGIISTIISTLSDQDFSPEGPIVSALEEISDSELCIKDFRKLTRYRKLDDFLFHQPNLPAYNTSAILQALHWIQSRVPGIQQPATTYHVLHKLFAEIDRSPLVNEQLRLLNAICLWISLVREDCGNPAVLRTLINGATSLLVQSDLTRAAQSLLDWAFNFCGDAFFHTDFRFAETLVRIGRAAYDFSCFDIEETAALGRELLEWAERQAYKLYKHKALRTSVQSALLSWPRELPTNLQAICHETTSHDLSMILQDQTISSNKFRLVKQLRDLARESRYDDTQFAQSDFWRLKECIPPSDHLGDDDLDAFCELLMMQKGIVNGLGRNISTFPAVRRNHISGIHRKSQDTRLRDPSLFPQQAIVVALLDTLHDQSLKNTALAYRTLRSFVFSSKLDPNSSVWPTKVQGELVLLQSYPRPSYSRVARKVESVLHDSVSKEISADFPQWITNIASLLTEILALEDPFYSPLFSTTQSDSRFSEDVLPVLVHTVLQAERAKNPAETPIRTQLSTYFSTILSSDHTAVACRRSIVDVVLHLRHFTPSNTPDALAYNRWLDLNFVLLSKNAIQCGAYTTALLFLELAAEYDQQSGQDALDVEDILFHIYSHIDEPDGFYGIRTADLKGFLVKRFHHEKQWDKAFQFHGAGMETRCDDPVDTEGVLFALHSYGFDHLAMGTLRDIAGPQQEHHMTYQLGWRTDTWDLPERSNTVDPGAPLYFALRAINRERDPIIIRQGIRNILFDVMEQFRGLGSENVTEIRQLSQSLMCVSQVKQWQLDSIQQGADSATDRGFLKRLSVIDDSFDFEDLETLMATRISLLRSARQKEQREQIGDMVSPFAQSLIDAELRCLLRLSEAAREAGRPQVALNSVIRAQKLASQMGFEVSQEFANVLWITKEPKIAVQYLRDLSHAAAAQDTNDVEGILRKALLLTRLGTWTSQACLERPGNIVAEYFAPAAKLVDEITNDQGTFIPRKAAIFHSYATFAERQYHALVKSPDALRWKMYMDRKSQEIEQRHQLISSNSSQKTSADAEAMKRAQRAAEVVLEKDKQRFEELNSTRYSFLEQAIEMHSRALEISGEFDDDAPIRLCSLWFANFDYDRNDFPVRVSRALDRVPSRKFVFLAHQLSARLSKSEGDSQNQSQQNLSNLVTRMCREHPFHSLYQVFCLKGDRPISHPAQGLGRRTSARHISPTSSSQIERAVAAQDIFDKLCSDNQCGERVRDIEILCRASLKWAKYPVKSIARTSNKTYQIPSSAEILGIRDIRVPPITAHTPLDPTCKYDNCEWMHGLDTIFTIAGGINLPKICMCKGTNGGRYKQLYKGEGGDDLRQDAVMEQVFDLVNIVLRHDRETRKRNLKIRHYKVIPLASQAGVIEFVVNTTQIGSWLTPAHQRYRPNDIPPGDFNKLMTAKRQRCRQSDFSPLVPYFVELHKRFKPVMRHFFTEGHKTPMSWFSMRLNYSRSVATTSIIGHILGLGDRHTSNLLIDTSTGEIVPIDLGISFEQGTLLPIPERVPFRLTPDMVDGLGTSGTHGVFQRCAEQTLRVLRDGSEVILTVLEVFKYDPLHSWTASELKIKRAQNDTGEITEEALRIIGIQVEAASGTADEAADRALSAVSRKLDKTLTVEFTVNELIAEATDVGNLALMYMGEFLL